MTIAVQEVDDLTIAFPANISYLMPTKEEIPEEFWHGNTKWNKVTSEWFFFGLINAEWTAHEGIDTTKALRHVSAILGSFEPQHEYKEAAVAYLLSLWFHDVKYIKRL